MDYSKLNMPPFSAEEAARIEKEKWEAEQKEQARLEAELEK